MFHEPSCFYSMTGLTIQVSKTAFPNIPALVSLATSALIALFMSPPWILLFCLVSLVPGLIISLCPMTFLSTPTMFVGIQEKTCLYFFKRLINACLLASEMVLPMLTGWSGYFLLKISLPLVGSTRDLLLSCMISFSCMISWHHNSLNGITRIILVLPLCKILLLHPLSMGSRTISVAPLANDDVMFCWVPSHNKIYESGLLLYFVMVGQCERESRSFLGATGCALWILLVVLLRFWGSHSTYRVEGGNNAHRWRPLSCRYWCIPVGL